MLLENTLQETSVLHSTTPRGAKNHGIWATAGSVPVLSFISKCACRLILLRVLDLEIK